MDRTLNHAAKTSEFMVNSALGHTTTATCLCKAQSTGVTTEPGKP